MRSSEAIKGKRRRADYRALLNAGEISEDPSPDSVPTGEELPGAPPSPPAFEAETQGGEEPPAQVAPPLREALQNTLKDLGTTLNVAVPTTTFDIQCKFDEWSLLVRWFAHAPDVSLSASIYLRQQKGGEGISTPDSSKPGGRIEAVQQRELLTATIGLE